MILKVLKWVRSQDSLRDLPVVILSSSDQPNDKGRAKQLGANDYQLKRSDPAEVVEVAQRLKEAWLTNVRS